MKRVTRVRRAWLGVGFALVLSTSAREAAADEWSDLRALLIDGDDIQVEEAALKLAAANNKESLEVILDALSVGAGPRIQTILLESLPARKDPRALDLLVRYARSRNIEVRKKAVLALAELPLDKSTDALIAALSDSVEEVRSAAATALGKRRATKAEKPLQRLFDRGDKSAATALGQLGGADLARSITEKIGSLPDAQVAALLGEMLKRSDVGPDSFKLDLVRALGRLPGVEATTALLSYSTVTNPSKGKPAPVPPSVTEAQKILDQRSGP